MMGLIKKYWEPDSASDMKRLSANSEKKVFSKPMICLIDVEDKVKVELVESGLNISSGTFGAPISVPNEERRQAHHCLPNSSIPHNLHEYDIVTLDMRNIELKKYIADEHRRDYTIGTASTYFESAYPETLFDPRPFGAFQARGLVKELLEKGGLLIVFAGSSYMREYDFVNVTPTGLKHAGSEKHSIYAFWPDNSIIINNKSGEQMVVEKGQTSFLHLLRRHCENGRYWVTFDPRYNPSFQRGDPSFGPLLRNSSGEIVGYTQKYENGAIIVLPDFHNKSALLHELLMNELPAIYPHLFPYHTQNRWVEEEPYHLPNQEKLIKKRMDTSAEFETRISEIEQQIDENTKKYSWLHGLLTKDSTELVRDVQKLLQWLEFDDVKYMDESTDDPDKKSLEEDLQIDIPKGLLVIEVKGISGTSKDEDCSQISKIKFRRAEERGSFDVYALYVVNHQKHLPPLERDNPPFKPEQIRDAYNDKRGLLTTWQLFNLYFSIEAGGITKEEARESLIEFGLVNFKPQNCEELGKPVNVLKGGCVVLFDISVPISSTDSLIIMRNERFYRTEILCMQSKGETVQEIESGQVGIEISIPAKKSDIFYLRHT